MIFEFSSKHFNEIQIHNIFDRVFLEQIYGNRWFKRKKWIPTAVRVAIVLIQRWRLNCSSDCHKFDADSLAKLSYMYRFSYHIFIGHLFLLSNIRVVLMNSDIQPIFAIIANDAI